MAEIGFLVLCDEATGNPEENQIALINPIAQLNFPQFPWSFTFTTSFSIYDIAPAKQYRLEILIKDPSNEKIWGFEGDFNSKGDNPEEKQQTIINMLAKNVVFHTDGIYTVEARIDNELKNQLKFPVRPIPGDLHG